MRMSGLCEKRNRLCSVWPLSSFLRSSLVALYLFGWPAPILIILPMKTLLKQTRIICGVLCTIYSTLYIIKSSRGSYSPEALGYLHVKVSSWVPCGMSVGSRKNLQYLIFYPLILLDRKLCHHDIHNNVKVLTEDEYVHMLKEMDKGLIWEL